MPLFWKGYLVYVERTSTWNFNATDKLVYESKSMIMHKKTGPLQIFESEANTVRIDEKGKPNSVYIYLVTLEPTRMT